jgi:hypothetical protein
MKMHAMNAIMKFSVLKVKTKHFSGPKVFSNIFAQIKTFYPFLNKVLSSFQLDTNNKI